MRLPFANANAPAATRRRWLDADLSRLEAYQRTGKGLLQSDATLCSIFCSGSIQRRQQRLDFAKFRRSLVPDPIDDSQQKPKPDLL